MVDRRVATRATDGRWSRGKEFGEFGLHGADFWTTAPLLPQSMSVDEVSSGELGSREHLGASFVHAGCEVKVLSLGGRLDRAVVESERVLSVALRSSSFGVQPDFDGEEVCGCSH